MSLSKKLSLLSIIALAVLLFLFSQHSRSNLEKQDTSQIKLQSVMPLDAIHSNVNKKEFSAQEIKQYLEIKFEGMEISSVEQSPMADFYQVFYGGELIYISKTGQFLLSGVILDISAKEPLYLTQMAKAKQDQLRSPMRAEALAKFDDSDLVVFKAKQEEFVITVFTDVDCGYCRKLHKEMPQLNEKGITVRYMAFPRAGIGSDSYKKLVSIWCADDRKSAMDLAKLERKIINKTCENPITEHYKLTQEFNLNGTPAIIFEDGELQAGYLPADEMYTYLVGKSKAKLASSNTK